SDAATISAAMSAERLRIEMPTVPIGVYQRPAARPGRSPGRCSATLLAGNPAVRLRLSVRSKLVLSTLILLVVVSFPFTAASLYFTEHLAEDDLRRRAIAFSREVAATVADRRELEDRQGLQIQIRRIIDARPNIRNVDFLALPDPEGWPHVL